MELRGRLRLLRRHLVLIILLPLFGVLGAGTYSALQKPLYQATNSLYVATEQAGSAADLSLGSTYAQQVVKSYADIVQKPIVLDRVIRSTGLHSTASDLALKVSADAPLNTTVLNLTVIDDSPERAAIIANATGAALRAVVPGLSPNGAKNEPTVKLTEVERATVPTAPVSPRVPLNLLLGLLAGAALGAGLAYLREALDVRIRGDREVQVVTDRPVLGRILFDREAKRAPLVVFTRPRSLTAEAFRTLRTNLQFIDFGTRSRSIVITSSLEAEGKSTTSANLAIAVAHAGDRVVLVDADLRRPAVDAYLGIDGSVGLTDVLIGRVSLDSALQRWGSEGLSVLPAGQIPPNPSELLQGQAMVAVLEELERRFGTVIIDAPPLLPVSDAAILARRTAGAILVAAARRTTRPQLEAAMHVVDHVQARVLGIVITMLPVKGGDAEAYGSYGHEPTTYGRTAIASAG